MKKNQSVEILEPEVEEIPLEQKIEKALIKANVTEKVLSEMKEKFGLLRLKDINDKEGYLDLKNASKEIRKVEIIAEKICKAGREDAVREQRLWLKSQNDFLEKSGAIKNPIDEEIKKFEDEVARKEKVEQERKEAVFTNRQSILLKYGAVYNERRLDLNEIQYEISLIRESDDETWEGLILPKYRRVYEEKEAARVEEENKRKVELERQEKERKELEEKRLAFEKEKEDFENQKREMQAQKEKQEREIREAEQEKQRQELAKKVALRNNRISELINMGCHFDSADMVYCFKNLAIIGIPEIENLSETAWIEYLDKVKPSIEKIKADEEEERQAKIAEDIRFAKELAARQERERIAEEEKKEAIRKAEELAQSTDKEKYQDVIAYLKKTPIHEMKSSIYKSKMNVIRDFLADLN